MKAGKIIETGGCLSILRKIDFFSEPSLETLKIMARLCTRKEYGRGDHPINKPEATLDPWAFYVVSEKAVLSYDEKKDARIVPDGRKPRFEKEGEDVFETRAPERHSRPYRGRQARMNVRTGRQGRVVARGCQG